MSYQLKGNEKEYLILGGSNILEFSIDEEGNHTGESKVHIITDSIENNEDRSLITEKLKDLDYK